MQSYFYVIWLGANEEKARGINVCAAAAAAGQQCSSLSEHHHISEQCQAPAQRVYFNAENSQEEGRKTIWLSQSHNWLASGHFRERKGELGGHKTCEALGWAHVKIYIMKKNMKWKGLIPYSRPTHLYT